MFETYAAGVLFVGIGLILAAVIWLIVRAFRVRLAWGAGCLLFPPALVPFSIIHRQKVKTPLIVLAVGALLAGGAIAVNRLIVNTVSLGPREKIVDGELHITLTGWDQQDYSVLRQKPETVVLQMANPDVTDETLEHLAGLSRLKELDLNDTKITDAGLETLAKFPALQILRLRGTAVTEEGFLKSLRDKASLLELDARDTQIASKTLRAWKAEKKDFRKFLK